MLRTTPPDKNLRDSTEFSLQNYESLISEIVVLSLQTAEGGYGVEMQRSTLLKHKNREIQKDFGPSLGLAILSAVQKRVEVHSQLLNLTFQLAGVGLILGPVYRLTFFLGVLIVLWLLNTTRSQSESLSKNKQNAMTGLGGLLGECWGTITISNTYNRKLWQREMGAAYYECQKNNSDLSLHKEFGGAIISLIGVLLDEWDANLDQPSRETLIKKIRSLNDVHLIIEVRHNE